MSSKRRIRRKSCTGKYRYKTFAEAETAARRLGRQMHAYGCRFCKGYHIGHKPGGGRLIRKINGEFYFVGRE